MRIIFFGTPYYTLPILEALNKSFKGNFGESPIKAVVTQKPRPTGRNQELTYSEVDKWAYKREIPKYYSCKEFEEDSVEADIAIVASYGEIIPLSTMKRFPLGMINIHPSLLPKHRGAAPIQATIASGDTETGITIIKLDEKMDHGPIITTSKEPVDAEITAVTLRDHLFAKAAEILIPLLPAYQNGKVKVREQQHDKATFTKQLTKDDGFVGWKYVQSALKGKSSTDSWEIKFVKGLVLNPSPITLFRIHRALTPWPGLWTLIVINGQEKRLKLLDMDLDKNDNEIKLRLKSVQLEGKNAVDWETFRNAYLV